MQCGGDERSTHSNGDEQRRGVVVKVVDSARSSAAAAMKQSWVIYIDAIRLVAAAAAGGGVRERWTLRNFMEGVRNSLTIYNNVRTLELHNKSTTTQQHGN